MRSSNTAIVLRHPLQEIAIGSFVANDTLIVGGRGEDESSDGRSEARSSCPASNLVDQGQRIDGPSMLLMTGPNYSGKTVYLKQVSVPTSPSPVPWSTR
jgi:DNA mismatch repair protein MSH5